MTKETSEKKFSAIPGPQISDIRYSPRHGAQRCARAPPNTAVAHQAAGCATPRREEGFHQSTAVPVAHLAVRANVPSIVFATMRSSRDCEYRLFAGTTIASAHSI